MELEYERGAWRWPSDQPFLDGVKNGARRFELEFSDHKFFRTVVKLRGLVVEPTAWDSFNNAIRYRVHGDRTLSSPKEDGYGMRGRVSLGGNSYKAFTSSLLVVGPDEQLVDVGVLYVVNKGDLYVCRH